jgi:hypothetical protein
MWDMPEWWAIVTNQKSMQRPAFSQSPKRVGSGPSRPPISLGGAEDGGTLEASPAGPMDAASGESGAALGRASGREFVSAIEPDDDGALGWRVAVANGR